jgi:hypothetical protein
LISMRAVHGLRPRWALQPLPAWFDCPAGELTPWVSVDAHAHALQHGVLFHDARCAGPTAVRTAAQGDEEDFAQYCRQWRRTEGATLTVTSPHLAEQSW